MEWICDVGYSLFPWVNDAPTSNPQNVMHLAVTVLVVVFSLVSLVLVAIGAGKENIKSLSIWAIVCLAAMLIEPMGTAYLRRYLDCLKDLAHFRRLYSMVFWVSIL